MEKKMNGYRLHELEINPAFRDLIPPLLADELKTLEESILKDGCIEPVVTWNGVIIDGHNRYSICHKYNIPFKVRKMHFEIQEEAISWICNNQLGRRSISPETRKYLIGKRYAAEKVIGVTNKDGHNQYTPPEEKRVKKEVGSKVWNQPNRYKTATKLGNEYNISHGTVCKYGAYSQEIDKINKVNSTVADNILCGKLKLSHPQLCMIAKSSEKELAIISDLIIANLDNNRYLTFTDVQSELRRKKIAPFELPSTPKQTINQQDLAIKKIPEFDPDAEITSLTLTIPSWIGSINRAISNSNLQNVSKEAKDKLRNELFSLHDSIYELMRNL